MIVFFEKPTSIKQHGLISECLFVECLKIDFAGCKAIISFGLDNDFCTVDINSITKIS